MLHYLYLANLGNSDLHLLCGRMYVELGNTYE